MDGASLDYTEKRSKPSMCSVAVHNEPSKQVTVLALSVVPFISKNNVYISATFGAVDINCFTQRYPITDRPVYQNHAASFWLRAVSHLSHPRFAHTSAVWEPLSVKCGVSTCYSFAQLYKFGLGHIARRASYRQWHILHITGSLLFFVIDSLPIPYHMHWLVIPEALVTVAVELTVPAAHIIKHKCDRNSQDEKCHGDEQFSFLQLSNDCMWEMHGLFGTHWTACMAWVKAEAR